MSEKMHRRTLRWVLAFGFLCVLSFFVLSSSCALARDEPNGETLDPDKFLAEYRRAADALEHLCRDVHIEGISRFTPRGRKSINGSAPAPRTRVTEFAYFSTDDCEKLQLIIPQPDYFDRVFVRAASTKFMVRRKNADAAYFLEQLAEASDDEVTLSMYRIRARMALYCPPTGPYMEYLRSPEFKVESATRVAEMSEILTKFVFHCVPDDKAKPRMKGWIVLDPAKQWVIRSYSCETHYSDASKKSANMAFQVDGSITYKSRNDNQLCPSEIKSTEVTVGTTNPSARSFEITRFEFKSTPRQEFALAAFGLGDVERTVKQIERRNTNWVLAVGLGAMLVGVVQFGLGRAIQKHRAHEASLPATD